MSALTELPGWPRNDRRHALREAVRWAVIAGACGVGVLTPGLGMSQEVPRPPRAWLGVGLQEVMECRIPAQREKPCRKLFVISQVVVDGPADRAGVQVGDTLVSLNGHEVSPEESEATFAALLPDTPVRLTVGRENDRLTLQVIPGARPPGSYTVRVRLPDGQMGVRRVTLSPPRMAPTPPRVAVRRKPPREPLVIRGEHGDVYYVRLAEVEAGAEAAYRVGGGAGVAGSRNQRARRVRLEARRAGQDSSVTVVYLDPGPVLKAVQESVFRIARIRLDSLQSYFGQNREGYRQLVEQLRLQRGRVGTWFGRVNRGVAGAEFEPLNPELAESFDGVDQGLLVLRVVAATPAARLGLRPGDVVTKAAGTPVASPEELREVFLRAGPGESVKVEWVRKGRAMEGVLRYD